MLEPGAYSCVRNELKRDAHRDDQQAYVHPGRFGCGGVVDSGRRAGFRVPSLADVGIAPFDGGTTLGMFVRSETPKPIITALDAAIVAALGVPAVRERLTELGAVVRPSTPEALVEAMKIDEASIGGLAKMGLLRPE